MRSSRGMKDSSNNILTLGAISNGQYIKRDGNALVGGDPSGGPGGTPSDTVTGETAFGGTPNAGAATSYSRGDHTHGSPTNPVTGHESTYSHALLHSNSLDHSNASDHTHSNKATLDTYSQTEANLSDAVSKKHANTLDHARQHTVTDTADHTFPGGTSNFLRSDGTFAAPPGGSTPAWKGVVAGAWQDGDPNDLLELMFNDPVNATPTNISITVARCSFFILDTALTVNKIRYFGVGATTNVYRVAIYRLSDLARLTSELAFTTASQAWGAAGSALNLTLAANTIYFIACSVNAVGTTAGVQCMSSTTGRIGVLPTSWPGSLVVTASSPKISAMGLFQFAVSTGALPNPAATLTAQAAWTGGCPSFFLDNSNA